MNRIQKIYKIEFQIQLFKNVKLKIYWLNATYNDGKNSEDKRKTKERKKKIKLRNFFVVLE